MTGSSRSLYVMVICVNDRELTIIVCDGDLCVCQASSRSLYVMVICVNDRELTIIVCDDDLCE